MALGSYVGVNQNNNHIEIHPFSSFGFYSSDHSRISHDILRTQQTATEKCREKNPEEKCYKNA